MDVDPFVARYGEAYERQLLGAGEEVMPKIFDAPNAEAQCVALALTTRWELMRALYYPEPSAASPMIKALRPLRPDEETLSARRDFDEEMGLLRDLVDDDSRLISTWGRLVGEGLLLLLAEGLSYSAVRGDGYNRAVELLKDVRDFIFESYHQIPLQRLRVTLRQAGVLLGVL